MTDMKRRQVTAAALGMLAGGFLPKAFAGDAASDYPSRPVKLIVPFPPGGGTDATMRIIARYFQDLTGQTMEIENRPGGQTLVMLNYLANQKPDGYTLGTMTRSQDVIYWRLRGKVDVNPLTGLTYVCGTHGSIFGMVVRADSPFNTAGDLVKYAKANPGKLSFGNIGVGSTHNLIALEFARLAGIQIINVAFKGEAESNTAAMGGHIDVSVSSGVFIPQATGGKMKVIGLALDQPLPAYPQWKTLKQQGYDVLMDTMVGIGGPKGMDEAVVAKLNGIFAKMTADPKFQAALMQLYQPVHYMPTPEYRKAQQWEFEREKKLVDEYHLQEKSA